MTIKHADFYLFEDMELYNKNFDRKSYMNKSKKEIIKEFREYYDNILPVDVTTWVRVNQPDKALDYLSSAIYGDKMIDQVSHVKDYIGVGIFNCIDRMAVQVISTHWSKSVRLPVMQLIIEELGVRFTFRYNFYDWNVSVESFNDIDIIYDFKNVFNDDITCFCQGFPPERVFGKYTDNQKKFTVCIRDHYRLGMFIRIIKEILEKHQSKDTVVEDDKSLSTDTIEKNNNIEESNTMNNPMFEKLMNHRGHKISLVSYGHPDGEVANMSIECEECYEVLIAASKHDDTIEESINTLTELLVKLTNDTPPSNVSTLQVLQNINNNLLTLYAMYEMKYKG